MIGVCEFCGEKKEVGVATPFHGNYCTDCMRMNIEFDKESIAGMKRTRREKRTKATLKRLETEKDEALAALMNYGQ